jgi:RNA polymerase sigma-70 factor, ECF subfamily
LSNLASQRIGTAQPVIDPFAEQILELLPRLRSYAMALSRSGVEADDLVQETVLKALRSRDRFEPGTNLVAWLFKILRNTFYNDTAGRRHTVQDIEGRHAESVATAPEQEWRLRYAEMLQALTALRPHHRDALLLVVGSGLSYEAAAEVFGCPVGTVKSRVRRARDHLAILIGYESPSHRPTDETESVAI